MLVTLVGRDMLRGRTLTERIVAGDYLHLICACLLHDIGFVRGILSGDTATEFVVDQDGKKVTLPRGASDAALAPYHVDRSKLFATSGSGIRPRSMRRASPRRSSSPAFRPCSRGGRTPISRPGSFSPRI